MLSVQTTACILFSLLAAAIHGTEEQQPLLEGSHGDFQIRNPFTDDFANFVEEALDEWHVAGLSIAVIDGDDVFSEGYGFATLPDIPATPETLWYVGSTTKAHTVAALGQLIDSNDYPVLSRGWKTPISSIIRDDFVLQDAWSTEHLTLEDAASHRTGFWEYDESIPDDANNTQHIVRDTVRNLRNFPQPLAPRTQWYYCNLMFTVLTHVIETITEKPLGDVLKDSIWTPLGMNHTYFDLQEAEDAPEHLATGYFWQEIETRLKPVPHIATAPLNGAGAMISNVVDYAKWVGCLLRKTEPLPESVHEAIRTPRMIQSSDYGLGVDATLYSLGWFRTTLYGHVAFWHSGSVGNQGALVYFFPELDYGVAMFSNPARPVRDVVLRRLVEDKLQIPEDKRYDITDPIKKGAAAHERDLMNATNILFPDRPEPPLPPTVEVSDLSGVYHNEGYGSFELRRESHSTKPGEAILVADRDKFVWKHHLTLHHASGDYWTVFRNINDAGPSMASFSRGRFMVGVDGKITGLAITYSDFAVDIHTEILYQRVQ